MMIRSDRLVVSEGRGRRPSGLAADLAREIAGEVRFDAGSQAIYAHDASNYRQVPIGVVIPRSTQDVEHALRICRSHDVPVVSRGGGTSLAGQTVNRAVVIDHSKYLNQVLEVDAGRWRVRVQPGCVLDDMRAALTRHGLTYGPDPATHNHCTLGGMLGNNSCGVHSVMGELYGPGARTSDHVESLEIVTYDGLRMRVGATSEDELARRIAGGGRAGEIYAALARLRDRYAARIRARFAPIPRRVSGYNLDELLPERGFHVARALVGSEATCVTVLEATLAVYPARPQRVLCVLGYRDVYEAGDHVPQIRAFRPIGLEGFDQQLIDDMRATGTHAENIGLMPDGHGWLLVEFGADTRAEALAQARGMIDAIRREPNAPSIRLFDQMDEAHKVWAVREAGLGATAFIPGHRDYWPGWEDSAVPPDRVGPYLRELRQLMQRHGLSAALYGHFGQGCIHCRIDFELSSPEGIATYKRFTDDAADLCVRHGGSISGEHGDGQSRGDLLVKQFGPELVEAFHEFKRIWDPEGRMNPGKIVDGLHRDDGLKLAAYHPPEIATTFHPPEDHGDFRHAAIRCVGIGNCRRSGGGTMCPSFMVTRDEQHTTRGRARLLFEMVQGEVIQDGWASDAVKDALDLCLACKGCKGDCPVHVDMATYKSEFLAHYYRHHLRPRHAYAFGWIHRWALLASYVPWLANFATQTPGLRRIAAWLAGAAPHRPIPRFAARPFSRSFVPRRNDRMPVVLWPDTFNNHFFPQTLDAAVQVLEDAGYRVIVPRAHVCCGRALYDYGMLGLARRMWHRTFRILEPAIARNVPIVGLEPSCVAAFRDELPSLFPGDDRARRLSELTHTLAGFLRGRDYQPPPLPVHALLHGHCHHKAVLDFREERELLAAMRVELETPDSGCCGLAGSFGYESEHYEISMAIGERVLLPAVRAGRPDGLVIADGFSCREQIRHGTGRTALHVAEVVALALRELQRTAEPELAHGPQPGPQPGRQIDPPVPAWARSTEP
ncbi:MAG TPA: FAD-binding and (Fe-S)-binding domain-containing protein [Kofleriaceae bacterium]|jgi:FAD/FMN-containing dehydrogenase/Fe-S oxidoreductase|nr:FAD-binding and (Fe-S)-binding domain-containing protein [Kofleriaceae bacterium]